MQWYGLLLGLFCAGVVFVLLDGIESAIEGTTEPFHGARQPRVEFYLRPVRRNPDRAFARRNLRYPPSQTQDPAQPLVGFVPG